MRTSGHETHLRTPLKRVRGLGASHSGVGHWWQTRLTSLALVPLSLWFVFQLLGLTNIYKLAGTRSDAVFDAALAWVAEPLNAVLLLLLTVLMFFHAASGIQAVLEDYVHKEGRKLFFIYAVKATCLVLGTACVFSICKIAFSHP